MPPIHDRYRDADILGYKSKLTHVIVQKNVDLRGSPTLRMSHMTFVSSILACANGKS